MPWSKVTTGEFARFLPLRDHPAEALRLLEEYAEALPPDQHEWVQLSLGSMREEIRSGAAKGTLWWGPQDEAVGLALWRPVEGLGRRVSDLYLAEGYRSGPAFGHFVEGIEATDMAQGSLIALSSVVPGVEPATQRAVLAPGGWQSQSRLAMRRSTALPLDRPPKVPPGRPIRRVEESDGMWIARLYGEAFEGSPDRYWVDHGDLKEDAEMLWKDLLGGRWGPWLASASFAHDRPGGLEGASLVSHPPGGRCPLLLELMVEPERQGHGLGRALLSRTIRALHDDGHRDLELNVVRENVAAFRLYCAMGFEPVPGTELLFWVRPGALRPTSRSSHAR